jgi:hypothetical protein
MVASALQCVARYAAVALLVLVVLFAQAGGTRAVVPHQTTFSGQPDLQMMLAQGDRSNQPAPCDDDGDATCCMNGHCQGIAGTPAYVPSSVPDAISSLTRYAASAGMDREGHAAGPALPPPRDNI